MRNTIASFGLALFTQLALSPAAFAEGLPVGTWKLANAYCSNPNYIMSPDEQAEVDSIRHKAEPFIDDSFTLTTPTQGISKSGFTISGMTCTQAQEMKVTTLADGLLRVDFFNGGESDSTTSEDGNTTVSCGHIPDAYELYYLRNQTADSFDLALVGEVDGKPTGSATPPPATTDPKDCGEYRRHFIKQ